MTYDYHGQWDKKTGQFNIWTIYMWFCQQKKSFSGHVAPMYEHPDDDFYFFNAVRLINLG